VGRTAILAAALAACASAAQEAPKPRNIVLIVIDDVGVDLIGSYDGHLRALGKPASSPASTPAIDALLAGRGVMFTNAWTAPMCSPSRAEMLTGRYGFRTGIGRVLPHTIEDKEANNPGLSIEQVLLPTVLHAAPTPYACGAVGKWHLASAPQLAEHPRHPLGEPAGRWFDFYAGSLFNLQDPDAGPRSPIAYSHWVKTYATAIGRDSKPCGDGALPCNVVMSAPPWENYATVDTADDAIALASSMREPWFLYVAFNAPHAPQHDVPHDLPRASCTGYTAPSAPCDAGAEPTSAGRTRCMLSEADAQIARVLCALGDEPVVILIGDNGTFEDAILPPLPSDHGKDSLYQGGVNVPLIVRSPEMPSALRGTTCDALVSSTDLLATIAELAHAKGATEDSISLAPYLRGESKPLRRTVYAEEFTPNFVPDPKTGAPPAGYSAERHQQTLRDARFKLIRHTRRSRVDSEKLNVREEFFDLLAGGPPDMRSDPPRPTPDWFEQNDLLRGTIAPDTAAAKALAALRAELDARYPCLVH
jgi:arylsulfatase A-like enzyme